MMMKMDGFLGPMTKGMEELKSLKRKSSGPLQKKEKKRLKNIKRDVSMKLSGMKNKIEDSRGIVPSKTGSPITTSMP